MRYLFSLAVQDNASRKERLLRTSELLYGMEGFQIEAFPPGCLKLVPINSDIGKLLWSRKQWWWCLHLLVSESAIPTAVKAHGLFCPSFLSKHSEI